MTYGQQSCPSCGRRWTPPGPCTNYDAGEVCGFREADPGPKAPAREPRTSPPIPRDGYRLRAVSEVGGKVDHRPYLAEARRVLADAVAAKGNR